MLLKNLFYKSADIETHANQLLADFYKINVVKIKPPIKIDEILELHLNLNILWEDLKDKDILAGLVTSEKLVVLNDKFAEDFKNNKGLENFTKAHEVGHWILHVDHSTFNSEPLPGLSRPYEIICRSSNKDWYERHADQFAGYLLMPKELILSLSNRSFTKWPEIYKLAEVFRVSVTAMKVRLMELNLVYITDDGNFYKSKEDYAGQRSLL